MLFEVGSAPVRNCLGFPIWDCIYRILIICFVNSFKNLVRESCSFTYNSVLSEFQACLYFFNLRFIFSDLLNVIEQESCKKSMLQTPGRIIELPIRAYAIQFLRDSNHHVYPSQAQAPETPDIVSHVNMPEASWDDHLTGVRMSLVLHFFI